ncbi:Antibiotic biosynthesis monooxygenase [Roseivivax sp. THAF40]|uniref:antibiotic biosynthesis monooxygenase n=1 Tax=unclassified Roseivivax TaxID=2639302 RepID=UPI0012A7F638|nr:MULTISPECIES: antibiotic biosynthesis monooxygenase [unclassified Roseivivax]QFS83604.1 Antibiotic biosynthesis monooxygenase [Roseivivax sp. THAF197b]QFT47350.1 Antibiotic biosynthesis monooxygenase [Roseivivax sp. THAF40]
MLDANMLSDASSALFVALRVAHSDAEACAAKLAGLNDQLEQAEGFLHLDVIRRDGGLGTDFFIIARFRSMADLEAWRVSPERAQRLAEINAMAIADISRQQMAGSSIWFDPIVSMPSPPKPPRLWKRWVMSFVAVYPALIVLVTLLSPLTAEMPEALRLLIIAIILTGLTTAFIMPWLTRRLYAWLHAR